VTVIDPTDSTGALGEWRFDPDAPQHAGWRERYAAFDAMYRPRLLRFVTAVADRKGLAEAEQSPQAVVQVALTRVAFNWPHVAAMDNPRAYVYTIAANLVRTAAIQRAQARAGSALLAGWTSAAVPRAAVATEAADRVDAEARERVEDQALDIVEPGPATAALAGLPLDKRMATYLFDVEGYSAKEIAEILGCTPKHVNTLTRAGRRAVRLQLGNPRHLHMWALVGSVVTGVAITVVVFGRQINEAVRGVHLPIHRLDDLLQLFFPLALWLLATLWERLVSRVVESRSDGPTKKLKLRVPRRRDGRRVRRPRARTRRR
jgi:DNA-directed RNA polymerase specialized sigma24 family protein